MGRAYTGEDNNSKKEMIEVIEEARNNLVEHTKDKADLSAKNQMIQNLIGKINNELKKEQELIENFQHANPETKKQSYFSNVKIKDSSELTGDFRKDKGKVKELKGQLYEASKKFQSTLSKISQTKDLVKIARSEDFKAKAKKSVTTASFTKYGEQLKNKNVKGDTAREKGKEQIKTALNKISGKSGINTKNITEMLQSLFFLTNEEVEKIKVVLENEMQNEVEKTITAALEGNLVYKNKESQRISNQEKILKQVLKKIFQNNWLETLEKKAQLAESTLDKTLGGAIHYVNEEGDGFVKTKITAQIADDLDGFSKKSKTEKDIVRAKLIQKLQGIWWDIFKEYGATENQKEIFNNAYTKIFSLNDVSRIDNFFAYDGGQITGMLDEFALALEQAGINGVIVEWAGKEKLLDTRSGNVDIRIIFGDSENKKVYGIQTKDYSRSVSNLALYEDTSFDLAGKTAERYFSKDMIERMQFLLINSTAIKDLGKNLYSEQEIKMALLDALPALARQELAVDKDLNSNTLYFLNGQYFFSSYILLTIYEAIMDAFSRVTDSKATDLVSISKSGSSNFCAVVSEDAYIEKYAESQEGTRFIKVDNQWLPRNLTEAQLSIKVLFKGIKIKLK